MYKTERSISRAGSFLAFALCVSAVSSSPLLGRDQPDGRYRLYTGAARPLGQVAILTNSYDDYRVRVESIDGVDGPEIRKVRRKQGRIYNRGGFNLELLPGPHALRLSYQDVRKDGSLMVSVSGEPRVLLFTAEPGRLYKVSVLETLVSWRPEIVDAGPIPGNHERPTASCDAFPKNGCRCLDVPDDQTPAAK